MNRKPISRRNMVVLGWLLVTLMPAATGAGCASYLYGATSSEGRSPFTDDHVATVRIVMTEENWSSCLTDALAEQYVLADFWFDDELVPDVGVRPKGNSSLRQTVSRGSLRIPLSVDFNLFNRARNFRGLKKVVLNNGWSDPTLIRERLAYEIFAQMGIPTPRATHVDVWVNDTHLGVYTMVEQVDATFLSRNFDDDYGNLYKPEAIAARLDWTEEDLERQRAIQSTPVEPDPNIELAINLGGGRLIDILRALKQEETVAAYQPGLPAEGNIERGLPSTRQSRDYLEAIALKTNENNPNYSALFHFLDVLNNEPDETFPVEIEKVLDVDAVLRFLAVSAAIVHLDNYIGLGHNIYLYEVNGKFHIIPWDLNMAFGTFNCGIRKEGLINYYIDEPTGGRMDRFPLVDRLLSHQPYLDIYHDYLRELIDGPFATDTVEARINELVELLRPYVEADTEKFYSTEDWERCLIEDLRPPDSLGAWQAGQASPPMPSISAKELSCLRKYFDIRGLEDLNRPLEPGDLKKIESCLTEEHFNAFVQNMSGPLKVAQLPRQIGSGANALGLKTFVFARHESIRQQLSGERPASTGKGTGNGVTTGMCAG